VFKIKKINLKIYIKNLCKNQFKNYFIKKYNKFYYTFIMDVIICAAGLGSRLSSYTHDIIPKYLVNIDDNTGLYHIIKYWNKYAENIYLIIHSKYISITQFYIKSTFDKDYNDKIKIIDYDKSDGTAYTLNYVINNEINNKLSKPLSKKFIITWCDLYLIEPLHQSKFNKPGIYIFTNGNNCRYLLNKNNEIINRDEECDGNILGIYYFHNIESFKLDQNEALNKDIVVFLSKIGKIFNYSVKSIIDYGDTNKINQIHSMYYDSSTSSETNNLRCRFFNQLTLLEDNDNDIITKKIFKKGITDKGKELIKNECEWFKIVPHQDFLPRIYSFYEHGYIMEYMENYIPLYKFFKNINNYNQYNKNILDYFDIDIGQDINRDINQDKNIEINQIKNNILKNIFNNLNILHRIEKINVSQINFYNNLKIEIFDKIYLRKKSIEQLLEYFGKITIVNGIEIDTFDNIVNICKSIIIKYYQAIEKYEYSIIMGDCQFSNILINPDDLKKIVFIDPRGYFGNSKIYGLIEYDYAKVLYGISGYDNFNYNNFNVKKINLEEGILEFYIEKIQFDENIIRRYFNKVHKAFNVIIWLSLGEYTKNDIWKCLCSYYHGLYLGTQLIKQFIE
jgi:hypothetical protein